MYISYIRCIFFDCKNTYPCMQESVFNVVLITFYSYIGIRILALKNYISCQEENCMLKKQLTMLNSQLGE